RWLAVYYTIPFAKDIIQPLMGLVDTKTGKIAIAIDAPLTTPAALAFSDDGKQLAGIDPQSRQVRVWNAATGKTIHEMALPDTTDPTNLTHFIAFDEERLISVINKKLVIIDPAKGRIEDHPAKLTIETFNWSAYSPTLHALAVYVLDLRKGV